MKIFFIKYQIHFALFLSLFAYIFLGYFFEREQFTLLLMLYSLAFFGFVVIMKSDGNKYDLLKIGLFFRILFIVSTPFLSQDFYRFIWDGHLMINGINPYLYKPNDIVNSILVIPNLDFLYEKMGSLSAAHYSNYPPINQLFFAIASFFGGKSIVISTLVLRLIIILADIGVYFYGKKILNHFNQNSNSINWYFLNPLVIIELTGNLHFEGVMLFLFTIGIYCFLKEKLSLAILFIALSIATKLLTLLLLPFFYRQLGFKKSSYFYFAIISIVFLTFLPFYSTELVSNYSKTIGLWFTNFEFNASFYYIIREIGLYIKGYNIIQTIGKITPFITILVFLYFAFVKKNKPSLIIFLNALFALSIYFFISTTVHPWYIINIVFLSLFTRFKFPIFWSYLVILSYFAYSTNPFKENYILLFIEYGLVLSFLFFELSIKKS